MVQIGTPISLPQTSVLQEERQNEAIDKGLHDGCLFVPTAYTDAGDTANVQLDGADVACAFQLTPEVDHAISSMSEYLAAIGTTGNLTINVRAEDGSTAPDWDGDYNTSIVNAAPVMTTNALPSPWKIKVVDGANANVETASYEAFHAMDGLLTGNGLRSNAAPTGGAPLYVIFGRTDAAPMAWNKFWLYSTGANFPKAFSFYGIPGTDEPNASSQASWVALAAADARTWTAEVDPGAAARYYEYCLGNNTAYNWYAIKIADRVGANAYFELLEIAAIACQSKSVPGALITNVTTSAVGAAAATWIRQTFTAYQLQRSSQVWFEYKGQAGKDFSIRACRNNPNQRSMFPDGVTMPSGNALIYTTDAWAHRKSVRIHKYPAMLNVVFNSTVNHSPVLGLGRDNGRNIYIPSFGAIEIPQTGLFLNCESLSADVVYSLWMSTTGTLLVDTNDPTTIEGIQAQVVTSLPYRFLGLVDPLARIGAYIAPIDVRSSRRVRDAHKERAILRYCPYYQYSQQTPNRNATWTALGIAATDLILEVLTLSGDEVLLSCYAYYGSNYSTFTNFLIDSSLDPLASTFTSANTGKFTTEYLSPRLNKGLHTITPVMVSPQVAGDQSVYHFIGQGPGGINLEPARKTLLAGEIRSRG